MLVRRAHVHVDRIRPLETIRRTKQEFGKSITAVAARHVLRELRRKVDLTQCALGIDDAGLHEEYLRTELDRVIALGPGVVNRNLPRL